MAATSEAAAESATAKMRRVLPEPLGRRLDALLATLDFTAPSRPAVTPETDILLLLAEAARHRRPVALSYTAWKGRHSERTVHPYGIVSHSGRWYVTGADSASGEVRTFRLDRVEKATVLTGTFETPSGFDPAARVLSGIAETPYLHQVSLRVRGTVDDIRSRLPAGIATVLEIPTDPASDPSDEATGDRRTSLEPSGDSRAADESDWVRVRLRAERLDWLPALLAGLDRPFVIEHPDALRDEVRSLARRLLEYADAEPPTPARPSSP